MILWNDIAKGEIPEVGKEVLWYPSFCFGYFSENGIVSMDSDNGWWDDLAYGFAQPETHRHKLPLDVVQYWTEVNHPE